MLIVKYQHYSYISFNIHFRSVTERAMQWQARVRQTFKRKEIEIALLEFSTHQQQQQKKVESKDQDRKSKRAKTKPKTDEMASSEGSDEENDV